jgi:5-methylcytosine-specific restriction endonuclease McrA
VPEPLAPTIDHIIALANGGTHEPTNVQCAHFICNATKGAREQQQLVLTA